MVDVIGVPPYVDTRNMSHRIVPYRKGKGAILQANLRYPAFCRLLRLPCEGVLPGDPAAWCFMKVRIARSRIFERIRPGRDL